MIRTLVIAVILTSGATAGRADECARVEQDTLAILKAFDATAQRAVAIGNRCMFRGTDPKAVKQLEASVRQAFKRLDAMRDPAASCVKSGGFPDAMNVQGQAFGLRVGLAWSLCSPDVATMIADLRARQVPDEQIKTKLGELSQTWLQGLTK